MTVVEFEQWVAWWILLDQRNTCSLDKWRQLSATIQNTILDQVIETLETGLKK